MFYSKKLCREIKELKEKKAECQNELKKLEERKVEESRARAEKDVEILNKKPLWCFFLKKDCRKDCVFYREAYVSRYYREPPWSSGYYACHQQCRNPKMEDK